MEKSAADLARRTRSPKRFAKPPRRRANRWKKFRCAKIRFHTRRSASTAVVAFCCDQPHRAQVSLLAAECARWSKQLGFAMCSRNRLAQAITQTWSKPRLKRSGVYAGVTKFSKCAGFEPATERVSSHDAS